MGTSVTKEGKLQLSDEEMVKLRSEFGSGRASDEEITKSVAELEQTTGETFCTHTAIGVRTALSYENSQDLICFATAHHGKFGETIAESQSKSPAVPKQLADLEKLKEFLINDVIKSPEAPTNDTSRLVLGALAA